MSPALVVRVTATLAVALLLGAFVASLVWPRSRAAELLFAGFLASLFGLAFVSIWAVPE